MEKKLIIGKNRSRRRHDGVGISPRETGDDFRRPETERGDGQVVTGSQRVGDTHEALAVSVKRDARDPGETSRAHLYHSLLK